MIKAFIISVLVAIFFGFVAFYYKNVAEEQERVKNVYMGNNLVLLGRMKKVYNDKVETDRTNEELRQAIRDDKGSSFNWGEDISTTVPVRTLIRMHKERNTVR